MDRIKSMPKTTKNHKETKTHKKQTGSSLPANEKTCARLRLTGALIALASVLMALLPLMFSGVHKYITVFAGSYMTEFATNFMVISGFVVALLYFLLGVHIIRAGERNTRLIRSVYQVNIILTFLAFVAGVLLFMPWPVPVFKLVMTHMATSAVVEQGLIPMFIMMYVDMALIIGLVASVSGIIYTCLIDKEKEANK